MNTAVSALSVWNVDESRTQIILFLCIEHAWSATFSRYALAPRRVSVFETPGNGELLNLRVTSLDKVSPRPLPTIHSTFDFWLDPCSTEVCQLFLCVYSEPAWNFVDTTFQWSFNANHQIVGGDNSRRCSAHGAYARSLVNARKTSIRRPPTESQWVLGYSVRHVGRKGPSYGRYEGNFVISNRLRTTASLKKSSATLRSASATFPPSMVRSKAFVSSKPTPHV